MSAAMPGLRPALVLRVGLVGHRPRKGRLLRAPVLQVAISQALSQILAILDQVHRQHSDVFAPAAPRIRLISGIAEGCDQIGMEAGLALGGRVALSAILPFPAGTCAQLMSSSAAKASFQLLLSQCEQVLALDESAAAPHLAHAAQAAALVEHCDILLAIWDGKASHGPGGTQATIRHALDMGVAVLALDLDGAGPFHLGAEPLEAHDRAPRRPHQVMSQDELGQLVQGLVAPPSTPDVKDQDATHHGHEIHNGTDEAPSAQRLLNFMNETPAKPAGFFGGRWAVHRMFRKVLGASRQSLQAHAPGFAQGWPWLLPQVLGLPFLLLDALFTGRRHGLDEIRLASAPQDVLVARAHWADALAVRYAELNRTAIMAVPLIGAVAVVAGLSVFVLAGLMDKNHAHLMKMLTLLAEAVLLALAYFHFYRPARQEHWHRRQVEYRVLAELARQERLMHLAGFSGHVKRPGADAKLPDEWIGWYLQATLRELGFAGATLGPQNYAALIQNACQTEITPQIAYNRAVTSEAHHFGWWLGYIAFGFFIMLVAAGLCGAGWLFLHGPVDKARHDLAAIVPDMLTAMMALFPAIIAAIHSVRGQLELEEQARRTFHTAQKLLKVEQVFTKALEAPIGRERARRLLTLLNDTLSADLTGWSTVYRHKAPETPG